MNSWDLKPSPSEEHIPESELQPDRVQGDRAIFIGGISFQQIASLPLTGDRVECVAVFLLPQPSFRKSLIILTFFNNRLKPQTSGRWAPPKTVGIWQNLPANSAHRRRSQGSNHYHISLPVSPSVNR
ncbi:MAG: hypothetical protein P2A85_23285 [Microcoleus anatoxicus]|uniref:hypothetical protein n=1 Tax=Microcoleus anatoxicus TaxID=2705319 RepID=UPI00366AF1A1